MPNFRVSLLTTAFLVVSVSFSSAQTIRTLDAFNGTNGNAPDGALIQGTDGNLYGTTQLTVFKMTLSGKMTVLHTFCSETNCTDGKTAMGAPVQAANGNLYGTTWYGGANNGGTVYEITMAGKFSVLYSFCNPPSCADGSTPNGLVQGIDGKFYGTTGLGGSHQGGTIFVFSLPGSLKTLYNFCSVSGCTDGQHPGAGLLQSSNGSFYGTAYQGGLYHSGTVFKISPAGAFTTLYNFCAQVNCSDGGFPWAGLIQGNDGNFYGTASQGGAYSQGLSYKITSAGALSPLHSFCAPGCTDGFSPLAGLVQGSDGNFYGSTSDSLEWCSIYQQECGTLFKMTPSGNLTTLYTFCLSSGCPDGYSPEVSLLQATSGYFYGSTLVGGDSQCGGGLGCGTVFGLSVGLGPFVQASPTFGRPGRVVRILGSNLTGTSSVSFNGTSSTFTVVSKNQIRATIPDGATSGFITVTTPTGGLSSNAVFTVTP